MNPLTKTSAGGGRRCQIFSFFEDEISILLCRSQLGWSKIKTAITNLSVSAQSISPHTLATGLAVQFWPDRRLGCALPRQVHCQMLSWREEQPCGKTFGTKRGIAHKRGHEPTKPVCQTGVKKIHVGHPKRWFKCPNSHCSSGAPR